MALVPTLTCDVFGTIVDVQKTVVVVVENPTVAELGRLRAFGNAGGNTGGDATASCVVCWVSGMEARSVRLEKDLSRSARKRLEKKVRDGMSPPPRKSSETTGEPAAATEPDA